MTVYTASGQTSSPDDSALTLRPAATPLYKEEYAEVKCQLVYRNVLLLTAVGVLWCQSPSASYAFKVYKGFH